MELPNSDWVRSPKKPEYAVCLDFDDACFGWIMIEGASGWESVRRLTIEEIEEAQQERPDFSGHLSQLRTLHSVATAAGG